MKHHRFSIAAFSTLALVYTLSIAHADVASLKDNMKHIKQIFKAISTAVSDPSKNAQSSADAASLVNLFGAVEGQTPESISSLPASEQPAALEEFKTLIHHEVELATALQKAFDSNNNSMAADLLRQMDAVRKDGHLKFAD
jgi:hypothetical protein